MPPGLLRLIPAVPQWENILNDELRDWLVETQAQEGGVWRQGQWYFNSGHVSGARTIFAITSLRDV